jgi:hypothetical protein
MTKLIDEGVQAVIGISFIAILLGTVFLIGPTAMSEPFNKTITQDQGDLVEVQDPLHSEATRINSTSGEVDITLSDNETDETRQLSFTSEGQTKTATISEDEITVTLDSIDDNSTATLTYEGPKDYALSEDSQRLFGIFPILIMLLGLVTVIVYVRDSLPF